MISVNLIPEDVQCSLRRAQHLTVWSLLLLVGTMLLTAPLVIGWVRRADARDKRAENEQLQARLVQARAKLRALEADGNAASLQFERAKALRSKRAWSAILAMIANRLPPGCWLTDCASDPAEPVGGGRYAAPPKIGDEAEQPDETVAIEAPRKLKISGYAATAAEPYQLVSDLKTTKLFTEVALTTSRREPALDASYFRFELVCEW